MFSGEFRLEACPDRKKMKIGAHQLIILAFLSTACFGLLVKELLEGLN
jgi:hypothetical protein